jgi:Mn-containing catalase
LQQLFETHLQETEAQVERVNECFGLLDVQSRAKPCKGMMGIVEEGEEVMAEGKKRRTPAADLALNGTAQKVEHYEISATSARETWRNSSTWRPSYNCCRPR